MNFKTVLTAILVGTILVILGATSVSYPSTANAQSDGEEHCVIKLKPILNNESTESEVLSKRCFSTIQAAAAFATNGRVQLPANVTRQQVEDRIAEDQAGLLNNGSKPSPYTIYIAAVLWEHPNQLGSDIWVQGTSPCSPSLHYGVQDVGAQFGGNWQNRISSAHGYANCDFVELYDNINYNYWTYSPAGGALIYCTPYCGSLGAMDDSTSSFRALD